ncbi:MAG: glutaredoxin family protein, partial [Myxococcota bacterium]|nr:glutaredoxin family protein [Myxococcota bacterium]
MRCLHLPMLVTIITFATSACTTPSKAPKTAESTAEERPPAPLTIVTAQTPNLLFRYRTKEGFETATTVQDIPSGSRNRVQVIDLAKSPTERRASAFVQVFDLSKADESGRYSGQFVPRADLESALAARQKRAPTPKITMYSAAWCGVCTKARQFMTKQGIPFVEKDIDKDRGAKEELARKTRAAGIRAGGVPVFEIAGQMMSGF